MCKYLGFADGDPVTGSYYGGGTGPVMMNGLGCYGYESNIVQCRNKGWMSYNGTECAKHKNDASVVCYKDGRDFNLVIYCFFFQMSYCFVKLIVMILYTCVHPQFYKAYI